MRVSRPFARSALRVRWAARVLLILRAIKATSGSLLLGHLCVEGSWRGQFLSLHLVLIMKV